MCAENKLYITIDFLIYAAPDAPPMNVSVDHSSISYDGFTLQWSLPEPRYQNGPIDFYLITMVEVETGIVTNYTSSSTSYYISHLHPAYTYWCVVAAYTVGLGPFSSYIVLTTAEYGECNACIMLQKQSESTLTH